MSAATVDTTTVKFHASLNVSNLDRSIQFYRALFGVEAAKCRPDYAKFELEEPPLVLSLIPGRALPGGNLNHVGMRLGSAEDLIKVQHRLEAHGIRTQREEGVECCYAKQTKFWVTDPDRALWEIYIFHEDIGEHGHGSVPQANQVESFAKDAPRAKTTWQIQLSDPIPDSIPHQDNSIHEISLEGSANLKPEDARLEHLLAEAFRTLRPGGEIRIHGLGADQMLPDVKLDLPGPAARVQYVPPSAAPAQALKKAGFAEIKFEKLSDKPYFHVAGIGLREILLFGRKPGYRPRSAHHTAIYLGPLLSVADDFGNHFPRGEKVLLNIHDWQSLKNGAAGSHFLLNMPEQMEV